MSIDKIHDRALVLPDYSGVRLGNKVSNRCRVPVITASHPASLIQTLLYDGPLAIRRYHETVQVDLKAIAYCIVIDSRRKPAGADESFGIEATTICEQAQFMRCVSRKPAAAATDVKPQFV